MEADVTGNLKRLGVPSEPLDGRSRLALLHSQMHPGSREPFRFSWQDIPKTGLGTKDYIAPDSFDFRQSRLFRVGQYWGRLPICRSWLRSSPTSSWRKSWSWTRS